MSALDEYLNDEKYEPELYDDDGWKLLDQARAEVAQLRAAAKEAHDAHVYLDESPVNGDPDKTPVVLTDRIALLVGDVIELRAMLIDRDRQLAEARR